MIRIISKLRAIFILVACSACSFSFMTILLKSPTVIDDRTVAFNGKLKLSNDDHELINQNVLINDKIESTVLIDNANENIIINQKLPSVMETLENQESNLDNVIKTRILNNQVENIQVVGLRKGTKTQKRLQDPDPKSNLEKGFQMPLQIDFQKNLDYDQSPPQVKRKQSLKAPSKNWTDPTVYPHFVNGNFVPIRRIVHLDLKGAPPKVNYFEKFFPLIKKLGATGILIEWEDTFPFSGELLKCRHGNAYSESDVRYILNLASINDLEVIPLVQTFGHLEWLLKHPQHVHLREADQSPQTICPTNQNAVNLVKTAIDQVMSIHNEFDSGEYFHIGADEVFQLGVCGRCFEAIQESFNDSKELFFLNHITTIAEYVKTKYNRRVLVWHDMLANIEPYIMKQTRIGDLVEPVVWAYVENLDSYLTPQMWYRLSEVFPNVWGASAFKGADGPSRFYSNILHYLKSHVSWSNQMTKEYSAFQEFRGLILTGWQRFDHFAILCELLPVGIPSLAVNLQVIQKGGDLNIDIITDVSRILECLDVLDIESTGVAGTCDFPGFKIYEYIQQLKTTKENSDIVKLQGWLTRFNILYNYTQNYYLDEIIITATNTLLELKNIKDNLRMEMSKIYHDETINEFFVEYIDLEVDRFKGYLNEAKRLSQIMAFPVRPFLIRTNNEDY